MFTGQRFNDWWSDPFVQRLCGGQCGMHRDSVGKWGTAAEPSVPSLTPPRSHQQRLAIWTAHCYNYIVCNVFVIKQNPNLYISVNVSVFTKLQCTYQGRYGGKITLKINLNVTRGDSLGELFWLGTYWLPSSRPITLQVITAAWRLWWRGGQMWIWTSLTWARRSTRPASAKSWSVPGHSWGKVSRRQCVDLYIHAHTRLMGASARIDTHRWEKC